MPKFIPASTISVNLAEWNALPKMHLRSALFLSLVVMTGCGLCSDEIVQTTQSPDRSLQATWFVRDCGATTDYSTIVSIDRPHSSRVSIIVFVAKGDHTIKVNWTGKHSLSVECPNCDHADIVKAVERLGDIDVSFRN